MKLTFRTVSGESFQIDVEDSVSIADLKRKVTEQRNIPVESLKLVYKGKVLDNETSTVTENAITEQGFIVVFVQPAKKPVAAAAPVSVCRVVAFEHLVFKILIQLIYCHRAGGYCTCSNYSSSF